MPIKPPRHHTNTAQETVISSGMGKGMHARLAVVLLISSILLGLLLPSFRPLALALFCLASAIGLLGEAWWIYHCGEVRVRDAGTNRFILIRRCDTPLRFAFYVALYTLFGSCFLIPLIVILFTLIR